MKLLNQSDIIYHSSDLWKLLEKLEFGAKLYTHALVVSSAFSGKESKPFLRRCLRTLEAMGLCKNFDQGFNIHQWQITEKGKEELKKHKENMRYKLIIAA